MTPFSIHFLPPKPKIRHHLAIPGLISTGQGNAPVKRWMMLNTTTGRRLMVARTTTRRVSPPGWEPTQPNRPPGSGWRGDEWGRQPPKPPPIPRWGALPGAPACPRRNRVGSCFHAREGTSRSAGLLLARQNCGQAVSGRKYSTTAVMNGRMKECKTLQSEYELLFQVHCTAHRKILAIGSKKRACAPRQDQSFLFRGGREVPPSTPG